MTNGLSDKAKDKRDKRPKLKGKTQKGQNAHATMKEGRPKRQGKRQMGQRPKRVLWPIKMYWHCS